MRTSTVSIVAYWCVVICALPRAAYLYCRFPHNIKVRASVRIQIIRADARNISNCCHQSTNHGLEIFFRASVLEFSPSKGACLVCHTVRKRETLVGQWPGIPSNLRRPNQRLMWVVIRRVSRIARWSVSPTTLVVTFSVWDTSENKQCGRNN